MNCRSITGKVPNLETVLETEDPDVIVGTESWLKSSVASGELFPSEYNVFRRDRQEKQGAKCL